jgi:dUTP pyrophosphatase
MTDRSKTVAIPTLIEEEAMPPVYASAGASGADIRAHLRQDLILEPGDTALVPTGLRFAIPEGYEIQVRPRSGLAFKHGITVLNTPGTIDADYRGEVSVLLINHSKENFVIKPGMRIAQLVLAPVVQAHFLLSPDLATTLRGEGGFGHTGTH